MRKKLGEILIASGLVTQADLDLALNDQMGGEPARVGDLLVSLGRITPVQLARALSQQHGIPFIQLPPVPSDVLKAVPVEFQIANRLVPFRITGDAISVAMADPSNADAIEELRVSMNRKVNRYVAASDEIDALHAGVTGASLDVPAIAPAMAGLGFPGSSSSPAPTAQELFGSLDLGAGPGEAPLGDDLFSGLDLPLPTTADVPPPPLVQPVASPRPFSSSGSSSARHEAEEEEPEFFESRPVVPTAAPPKPPSIAPTPAPSFELDGLALESTAGGLTSSPSGTFELSEEILETPASAAPETFEVSLSEGSGDFGPPAPASGVSAVLEVAPSQSSGVMALAESSGNFEVALDEDGEALPVPAAVEASGSFEVVMEDGSSPVAGAGAFSTDEEESVTYEELPEPAPEAPPAREPEAFAAAAVAAAEELFSDPSADSLADELFSDAPPADAPPPAPSGGLTDELFSDAPPAGVQPPASGGLSDELFSDAPPADAPPPAPSAGLADALFSDAPEALASPAAPGGPPGPDGAAPGAEAWAVDGARAAPPPRESMPSWLGGAPTGAPGTAPALTLTPSEWTGALDEIAPSRLIVAAVKVLLSKGLVTEAELLVALEKKQP